jgi:hypothetical protein
MKAILKNTTVRYTSKKDYFTVFKGKGNGRQIAGFKTMEQAISFDENFMNIEYRFIKQASTGEMGGAHFYKGTNILFDNNHPFFNDFTVLN